MKSPPKCCRPLRKRLDTRLFKALGDPTRVGLLAYLAERCRPMTVMDAAKCCSIDLSVVSRHLAVLREARVLESEKNGREVRYTVRYSRLAQALRDLADALESCCSLENIKTKEVPGGKKK